MPIKNGEKGTLRLSRSDKVLCSGGFLLLKPIKHLLIVETMLHIICIYVYALINKCFKRKNVDVASLLKYALPNLFCQLGSGSILVKAGHGRKVLLK